MKFCYITNIFDLHTFDSETKAFLKNFKFPWKCILFLYFSKWKKYYNLTFDYTFEIYCFALCNLNSSFINKPY